VGLLSLYYEINLDVRNVEAAMAREINKWFHCGICSYIPYFLGLGNGRSKNHTF
jgi:hypothetical protein